MKQLAVLLVFTLTFINLNMKGPNKTLSIKKLLLKRHTFFKGFLGIKKVMKHCPRGVGKKENDYKKLNILNSKEI